MITGNSSAKIPLGIHAYMHCSECIDALPKGKTPQQWASFEVGLTHNGLQVWCKRHKINVLSVDFGGELIDIRAEDPPEAVYA